MAFRSARRSGAGSRVPILFLTALGSERDVLRGYALGCDDYVTKPFSLAVLLAKTEALIRRSGGGDEAGLIVCGAIALDTGARSCTVSGEPVKLSPREYELLCCLMRNRGRVLSREQLLDRVWGLDFEGGDRAVDARIRSLRSALGEARRADKDRFQVRLQARGGMNMGLTRPRRLRRRIALPLFLAFALLWLAAWPCSPPPRGTSSS